MPMPRPASVRSASMPEIPVAALTRIAGTARTIIAITAWHDNTPANPYNPDPTQWVGNGDRSIEEMAHAWVNVTYLTDDDYKAEVEKRKAAKTVATQDQQQ